MKGGCGERGEKQGRNIQIENIEVRKDNNSNTVYIIYILNADISEYFCMYISHLSLIVSIKNKIIFLVIYFYYCSALSNHLVLFIILFYTRLDIYPHLYYLYICL